MYTQCPDCQTAFRVTAQVLQKAGGRVRCGGCGNAFSALDYLSEKLPVAGSNNSSDSSTLEPPTNENATTQSANEFSEKSEELLKSLRQFAGDDDVRIEDTGVEWRVLENVEEENIVIDASGAQDEPGQRSLNLDEVTPEEQRYDDNTPLPDDFYSEEETPYTLPTPRQPADDLEPVTELDTKQVDLALDDESDDWADLLADDGIYGIDPEESSPTLAGSATGRQLPNVERPEPVGDAPTGGEAVAELASSSENGADLDEEHDLSAIPANNSEPVDDREHADSEIDDHEDDGLTPDEEADIIGKLRESTGAFREQILAAQQALGRGDIDMFDTPPEPKIDTARPENPEAGSYHESLEPGTSNNDVESGEAEITEPDREDGRSIPEPVEDDATIERASTSGANQVITVAADDEPDESDPEPAKDSAADNLEETAAEAINDEEADVEESPGYNLDDGSEDSADEQALDELDHDKARPETDEINLITVSADDASSDYSDGQSDEDTIESEAEDLSPEIPKRSDADDIGENSLELEHESADRESAEEEMELSQEERLAQTMRMAGIDPSELEGANVETIIMEGSSISDALDRERHAEEQEAISKLSDPDSLADTYMLNKETGKDGRRFLGPASAGMVIGVVILALLLVAQWAHNSRETLATTGFLKQPVATVYRALGQPMAPAWNVKGWQFLNTRGSADDENALLTISSSISNSSAEPLPYPLVHVSLTDRYDEIIGSKVLEPGEYLAEDVDPSEPVPAGERFSAAIAIPSPSAEAVGFKLNVCYRQSPGIVRCATEDFKD